MNYQYRLHRKVSPKRCTSKSPNLNNSHLNFEFQRKDGPHQQQRPELRLRWCCVIRTIVDAALTHYKHTHSLTLTNPHVTRSTQHTLQSQRKQPASPARRVRASNVRIISSRSTPYAHTEMLFPLHASHYYSITAIHQTPSAKLLSSVTWTATSIRIKPGFMLSSASATRYSVLEGWGGVAIVFIIVSVLLCGCWRAKSQIWLCDFSTCFIESDLS